MSARCVPRSLTVRQKSNRVTGSKDSTESTGIKSSVCKIHGYITISTVLTMGFQRKFCIKRGKIVFSVRKVMAVLFWNCQVIIFVDYLLKCKLTAGAYCESLLERVSRKMSKIGPQKILFHQLIPLELCSRK